MKRNPEPTGRLCHRRKFLRSLGTAIASAEHWHAVHAVSAARAGKDIYCEKAMAASITESQAMVKAVRCYGRVFQTGTQQRSGARFRFACELVRNGYLGEQADRLLSRAMREPWQL